MHFTDNGSKFDDDEFRYDLNKMLVDNKNKASLD